MEETKVVQQPVPDNSGGADNKSKTNRTILIVVGIIVVLCCCCVVLGGAGFFLLRSNSVRSIPVIPTPQSDQLIPDYDPYAENTPPEGGLGNEILKTDTWNAVSSVALGLGCDQPIGSDSTIEVLQQPDGGHWAEKWTVSCASGESYPFQVDFTLDSTGTTYNIKSLP